MGVVDSFCPAAGSEPGSSRYRGREGVVRSWAVGAETVGENEVGSAVTVLNLVRSRWMAGLVGLSSERWAGGCRRKNLTTVNQTGRKPTWLDG